MIDYVRELTVEKSLQYGESESFEHLLFLFYKSFEHFLNLYKLKQVKGQWVELR